MTLVKPQEARFKVQETSEGLKIDIPVPMNFQFFVFLVWLCGWGFFEFTAGRQIISGETSQFSLVWMCLWSTAGIAVALWWLWLAFGRTVVVVQSDRIEISWCLFGLKYAREYVSSSIYELRWREASRWGRSQTRSAVQFSYGYRTVSFGGGLSFAEGQRIINLIKQRIPQIAACSAEVAGQSH